MIARLLRQHLRRKGHIRRTVTGTADRPRLTVYRSGKHIYAQMVDDSKGRTLASASSLSPELKTKYGGNIVTAEKVGALLAERAKAAKIGSAVFDRNGRLYHGRVKALAEAVRKGGLKI